jgi:uncharacterized protein (TIGR03435 family)
MADPGRRTRRSSAVRTSRWPAISTVYVLKRANPHKVKEWVEPLPGQPRAVSGAGGATDGGVVRRMAGWSMDLIAGWFGASLNQPVIDETGLTGKYDITLQYFPDAQGAGDERGPSLIQAAKEQAGLILEPAKRTIGVLVIDRIERTPTDN